MTLTFRAFLCLICLGASAIVVRASTSTPRLTFTASASEVACYDFVEMRVDVAGQPAGNPFTEVAVTGTFGIEGQSPLAVEGFCDSQDGSVFRVRFMPAKPGKYQYSLEYSSNGYKQTQQGSFVATDQQRRGSLRVDPQYPFHFQWEGSKERYFWNGTTAYWLAGLRDEDALQALDRLDRFRITRVRAALAGRVADGRAWFEPVVPTDTFTFKLAPWIASQPENVEKPDFDVTRFNVAYWQKWERLLAHARTKDLVLSIIFYVDGSRPGVDPFGKSRMGGEDEQRYYRYAVARFGAYTNVMWDLANEYRLFRDDAWAEKMGTLVKKWDPYGHLTSTHGHEDFRFRQAPWADFALYQCWDEYGGYDFMVKNREEQKRAGRTFPQINEEYGYEDHYPQGWGENRVAPARSADTRVRLAWEICLAGGYQTTGERANSQGGGGWLNGRGDESMVMLERYGHLYDFFTGVRWWELEPSNDLVVSAQPHPASANKAKPRVIAARNPGGDLAALYVQGGGVVTVKDELLKDQLKPLWFSPRDGGMRNARALRNRTYRTPTAEDWVLLFRAPCNCSFRDFDNEYEK